MEMQVAFPSEGEMIFGVLHMPAQVPAPGLVMCHGFTGQKAEAHRLFVNAARDFCEHGLAVLRFDFRGSGDSAGEFREMTVSREITDAQAAFDFLASRSEADPKRLAVLGLSLGGCVAACLAGREERLRALVLWAAVARPASQFQERAAAFGEADVLDHEGWELGRGFMEDLRNLHPLEEVKSYRGPSLVVHGSRDESVSPSDASDYRIALGGGCRLVFIRGADHVFSGLAWKSEAIGESRRFLVEALEVGG